MKDLKALLGEKKKINPMEKDAKLAAVKGMRKMAGDLMADEMKAMKKVTVAAPDNESLKAGLEKAEDVIEDMPEDMEQMEESDEMSEMVDKCETPEQIDELMQKLAEKKAELAKLP